MELSILHDGQFFIGLVEYRKGQKVKFVKYTFGVEPDDEVVLQFITNHLLACLDNAEVEINSKPPKKHLNPKRLQRRVAKEQKQPKDLTKAQMALKEEQQRKKKRRKQRYKADKEAEKAYKRRVKRIKAKEKHKGH
ncbi:MULTISPECIES: YjdF family protein [Staphylococcus]|uniref:YjdF family protein n=1 Tax=Staphylococcus TaxID=1279 RepID=UPI00076AF510|nr:MULTISPECIES: YjdF family protein [Staphylococcus]AMG64889.1 DUF2992 domain-containing protein [Staphylococcus lugdunensis]ARB78320.1 DUF2992 domain-containing protein [Staphylococcus lugdunensis]ARJ19444.1 hypothetical protein B7467_10625 [Staphylococcus lugdunensis]MBM7132968.1 YjdF family protein [Staphylococcus lugdunensis]MCH8641376.1 YjdF family protein [Staphylococcus lugdunensis]